MARFQKIEARQKEETRRLLQQSQSEYPDYDFPAIRKFLESAIDRTPEMEMNTGTNPLVRPYPGFS